MCDGFEDEFGRSSCANGVFMENFNTEQKAHVSKYLKESDPFYPCAKQAERHKADCYLYAPTYYLDLGGDDYAAALEWCEGAEAGYEPTPYQASVPSFGDWGRGSDAPSGSSGYWTSLSFLRPRRNSSTRMRACSRVASPML
jgi:hypothetical protein